MRPPCGHSRPNTDRRLFSATIASILFSTVSSAYAASVLPANAGLVLTKDFCAVTANNREAMRVRYEFYVGEALCPALEAGLKPVFTTLTRLEQVPEPGSAVNADLVLVPRFVDLAAAVEGGESKVMIAVEWTAHDRRGKLVWLQTVRGSYQKKPRNTPFPFIGMQESIRQLTKGAAEDLTQNTASQILMSPEIAKVAVQ